MTTSKFAHKFLLSYCREQLQYVFVPMQRDCYTIVLYWRWNVFVRFNFYLYSPITVENNNRQWTPSAISEQETQLMLTNRATRLEVSQGHQTWYHSICYVWFPISYSKKKRFDIDILQVQSAMHARGPVDKTTENIHIEPKCHCARDATAILTLHRIRNLQITC